MRINFVRNATLIIEAGDQVILVDPMLGAVGELPPLSVFRHKAKRNPLVPLPERANDALDKVTLALVTHCQRGHADHLDGAGKSFLRDRRTPTYCRDGDHTYLKARKINALPLVGFQRQPFLDGFITPIPARHGHGWIASLMGPGVGYVIELPSEPVVYIAGDTVMTDEVRRALVDLRPDVAIVAAGHASTDVGASILMSLDEVMEFTQLASGKVVANHLEALNHCPTTRQQVKEAAQAAGLGDKLQVPNDGDVICF